MVVPDIAQFDNGHRTSTPRPPLPPLPPRPPRSPGNNTPRLSTAPTAKEDQAAMKIRLQMRITPIATNSHASAVSGPHCKGGI
eukprot:399161-Rhodomonas_salina.2